MMQGGIIRAFFAFLVSTCLSTSLGALRDSGYKQFDCPGAMEPSKMIPLSAHAVRPADIKVIAGIGDSLTAGNGAGATSFIDVIKQYRGLAFTIGGDKGLENHVTIPNILLKFNPTLIGQSHGIGRVDEANKTQLNVAFPGAKSKDLPREAQELVRKIVTHRRINALTDWKLITIFIGANDICFMCQESKKKSLSIQNYEKNLRQAIQILHAGLTRVIVNIVGMFQMQILRIIHNKEHKCKGYHEMICDCAVVKSFDMGAACRSYQKAEMDLQTEALFEDREDFTVVLQPYLFDTDAPPLTSEGKVDLSFFAEDCLHFSQYGHAVAAKGLWNNMMQPVDRKSTSMNLTNAAAIPLMCPDSSCPFIRTKKNSEDCEHYMKE
uniref:Phospholipase B1, membrane-associated n=1 Tax=Plectus sambesii TaxID=2011161 RepID=A0A914WBS5_9BILA